MSDQLKVKCPCCDALLFVDRRTGEVIESRAPLRADSKGDRFDDAIRNARERSGTLGKKVEEARKAEKGRSDRLNALFKENLERAKEEGPATRPENPLDLD